MSPSQAPQDPETPPFARRPVLLTAALVAAFLTVTAPRYGYHRDELYFLEAGRHPAWGYDDQPPLSPLLMRAETAVFGTSVEAVRLIPLLCSVGLVLLAALSARELGGGRRAQTIAAASVASTPMALFLGHLFVTATIDFLVWALILFLLTRWIRTRDDRLWPWIGLTAGLGLLNNNLVAGLAAVLVVSALIAGPREIFRNRRVWLAAVIALVLWLPYLVWQARHGWPETKMMAHISGQQDERIHLLPFQILAGALVTPVWFAGLWRLARNPETRPYRMLAWSYPLLLGLLVVTGGKRYYPDGFLPLYFGAGSVAVVRWLDEGGTRRRAFLWAAVALTTLSTIIVATPVLPAKTYAHSALADLNKENGETIGWPQLVREVSAAYATIPEADRPKTVLLAENYGIAGALAHFGPAYHLPQAYSPHNGYRRFGVPTDAQDGPVLLVGYRGDGTPPFLSGCVQHGVVDNGIGARNQEQGHPIWVCSGTHKPWSELWPTLVHYS